MVGHGFRVAATPARGSCGAPDRRATATSVGRRLRPNGTGTTATPWAGRSVGTTTTTTTRSVRTTISTTRTESPRTSCVVQPRASTTGARTITFLHRPVLAAVAIVISRTPPWVVRAVARAASVSSRIPRSTRVFVDLVPTRSATRTWSSLRRRAIKVSTRRRRSPRRRRPWPQAAQHRKACVARPT